MAKLQALQAYLQESIGRKLDSMVLSDVGELTLEVPVDSWLEVTDFLRRNEKKYVLVKFLYFISKIKSKYVFEILFHLSLCLESILYFSFPQIMRYKMSESSLIWFETKERFKFIE